jgi:hypothetical protein
MKMRPEAQRLLDAAYEHAVAEYGKRGYEFWRQLIGDQINLPHPDDPSKEIEIMPLWQKKPHEKILVAVSVLHMSSFLGGEPTRTFVVDTDGSLERWSKPGITGTGHETLKP